MNVREDDEAPIIVSRSVSQGVVTAVGTAIVISVLSGGIATWIGLRDATAAIARWAEATTALSKSMEEMRKDAGIQYATKDRKDDSQDFLIADLQKRMVVQEAYKPFRAR